MTTATIAAALNAVDDNDITARVRGVHLYLRCGRYDVGRLTADDVADVLAGGSAPVRKYRSFISQAIREAAE